MNKTAIDWCDLSWNPLTGCLGPADGPCPYCYARRIAERFAGTKAFPNGFAPTFHPERLDEPLKVKTPSRIFCGSMCDPFAPWVSHEHLDRVLEVIGACPQHQFFMLTKWPQNIMRALYEITPDWPVRDLGGGDYIPNLWIGVSITKHSDTIWPSDAWWPYREGPDQRPWPRMFASIEPLMMPVGAECIRWADWFIVGAMTGPGAKRWPVRRDWVDRIVVEADKRHVPVFLKSSITSLWPDMVRQEWPDVNPPSV